MKHETPGWPHNWRAGASQPSRATGTIFLHNYIYKSFLLNEGGYRDGKL